MEGLRLLHLYLLSEKTQHSFDKGAGLDEALTGPGPCSKMSCCRGSGYVCVYVNVYMYVCIYAGREKQDLA